MQEVAVAPLSLADEVAEALSAAPSAETSSSLSTCPPPAVPPADRSAGPAAQGRKIKFTWRIENFMAFKEIMETRKIFSRWGSHGPIDLRFCVCAAAMAHLSAVASPKSLVVLIATWLCQLVIRAVALELARGVSKW